jgi:hypothetical protein
VIPEKVVNSDVLTQLEEPPAGFFEASTLPDPSTTTHKDTDGQETSAYGDNPGESMLATDHAAASAVGCEVVRTSTSPVTPTQSFTEGQDTASNPAREANGGER